MEHGHVVAYTNLWMRDHVLELDEACLLAFPCVPSERQLTDGALEAVDVEGSSGSKLARVAGLGVPWDGDKHVPAI